MHWIDATDLQLWSGRLDSRATLPLMLRLLIRATTNQLIRVDFPGGESVQRPGWDGIAETGEAHTYVPLGISGWELSTERDVKGKADQDYLKRTRDPGTLDPSSATFVFVTLRRWTKKDKWAAGRKAEGIWHDVRAYDADDLEQWLDLAPAVALRMANHLGKHADGVLSVTDWWEEYTHRTTPPLPPVLLLAGRSAQQDRMIECLRQAPVAIGVMADAPSEALGFAAAAITEDEGVLARAIVVRDPGVLRRVGVANARLVILWDSDDIEVVGSVVARGHHVLIPEARGAATSPTIDHIILERLSSGEFIAALAGAGLDSDRAESLAKQSGRSIPVLQRRIPAAGRPSFPEWANPAAANDLLPVLLVGSWRDRHAGDQAIIGAIAGTPYDTLIAELVHWSQHADPPIRRIGEHWLLTAPVDAWHLLAGLVMDGVLARFHEAASRVLSERNPALDLDPKDRWAANVYRKEFSYSADLRAGIARTIALLGTRTLSFASPRSSRDIAGHLVGDILGRTPGYERWYSLQGLLSLLAEAAPEEFLRAVEDELSHPKPTITNLFVEEGWLSDSAHTGLLWALERLAWLPQYLARVVIILARLSRLDFSGQSENRPLASLHGIFRSWMPQTCATLIDRHKVIDLLISKEEDVTWQVLCDLLPTGRETAVRAPAPDWRDRPTFIPTTSGDIGSTIRFVAERAVTLATTPERLAVLVKKYAILPHDVRGRFLENIEAFARSSADTPERIALWDSVRSFVYEHHEFRDAQWALPDHELSSIERTLDLLAPVSPVARSSWLFEKHWPHLPSPRTNALAIEAATDTSRQLALKEIIETQGIAGVLALARSVKFPGFVGRALAELGEFDGLLVLRDLLCTDEECLLTCGAGFVTRTVTQQGTEWANSVLALHGKSWSIAGRVAFLLALPVDRVTWDLVRSQEADVASQYWSRVGPYGIGQADAVGGIEAFLTARRHSAALVLAANHRQEVPSALFARLLDELAVEINEGVQGEGDMPYLLGEILDTMQERGDVAEVAIARLEWVYLPLLDMVGGLRAPILQRMTLRDPSWFAELITYMYRPHGKPREEPITESVRQRGHNAHALLSSLQTLPGMSEHGVIEPAELRSWVEVARAQCARADRATLGDQHIGQLLAYAPQGTDGAWPHEAVRDLLEEIESAEIEIGVFDGVRSRRGGTTKQWDEGGRQEHELAATYRAWAATTGIRWPRTTELLERLASDYGREAQREDERAEHDKTLWG